MIYGTDFEGFAQGFVHKRIFGAAKGFLTGGVTGAISGAISGTSRRAQQLPARRPSPRSTTARPSAATAAQKEAGRQIKATATPSGFTGFTSGRCIFPLRRDPRTGECRLFLGTQTGRDPTPIEPTTTASFISGDVGEAVMGRYGAALVPGNMVIDRALCLRGMHLGDDGLCYNKSQITNRERMWPRGRKPLLTGGEMRAISIAAAAGRRVERTTQRLQDIGFIKKPIVRKRLKSKH